jgi:UDP-N-acetylmuramyl pentapeptide phosphotransferase/UDP-N-acetylglucosamine-1-phosphate transferase
VNIVLAFACGLLAARVLLHAGHDILASPTLQRTNYRERVLPTAAGLFAVLAVLTVEAGRSTLGAFGIGEEPGDNPARTLVLFACLGFGLLGFLDDVLGTGDDRGFKGHLRALASGRVTTGLCKVIGGVAVAFILASQDDFVTGKRLLSDAVLIALAANLGNLLDRAPGRTLKLGLLCWIPIAVLAGTGPVGMAIAPVMGAFAALLGDDLREKLMLGDTGANVLGAVLGLACVLEVGRGARNVILVALVLLNLAAEFVSFSRVITRVPPLRAFDELGRKADPAA